MLMVSASFYRLCEFLCLVSLQKYCYIIHLDLEITYCPTDIFLLSYSIYGK